MRCDHRCECCGRCWGSEPPPTDRLINKGAGRLTDNGRLVADIGTTAIRLSAIDLLNRRTFRNLTILNPQLKFGADVLTRISRWRQVQQVPITGVLRWFLHQTGIDARHTVTVVGNTTMMHFTFGENPTGLGTYPYRSALPFGQVIRKRHDGIPLRTLPILGPFLGSDCTAAIIASGIAETNRLTLLIDAGTNGEVVLGNRKRIVACSTAAGPAFEGATLECGSLARPGAITACRFHNRRWQIKTIGDAKPNSICGSGVLDAIAAGVKAGLIRRDGKIKNGQSLLLSETDPAVYLTQADIRAVQLAKAAIASGIKILFKEWGGGVIERVIITGRFGGRLRTDSAVAIGLLPELVAKTIRQEPDLALKGAARTLLNPALLETAAYAARLTREIRLAEHPDFENCFIKSMAFSRWRC